MSDIKTLGHEPTFVFVIRNVRLCYLLTVHMSLEKSKATRNHQSFVPPAVRPGALGSMLAAILFSVAVTCFALGAAFTWLYAVAAVALGASLFLGWRNRKSLCSLLFENNKL